MIITETERLLLRPFGVQDMDAMCQVLCDPEVMLFSTGVKTPEGVGGWIENCIDSYSRFGFGLWAVVEKNTQGVIGYCGLSHFADIDGQPEIEVGFRLIRKSWSKGYATEAASAVRDHAFLELRLARLIALVDPDNAASIRVVGKLGMCYEKDVMVFGYDHPDHLYAMCQNNGDG